MIDEQSHRLEDFDEENSVWVTMSDGQAYALPKPFLSIRQAFRDGAPTGQTTRCLTYGPELDKLIEAVHSTEDPGTQITCVVALAAYLLRRNYDLADDELSEILVFRAGEQSSLDLLVEVMEIANGRTGKKV